MLHYFVTTKKSQLDLSKKPDLKELILLSTQLTKPIFLLHAVLRSVHQIEVLQEECPNFLDGESN